MGKKQTSQIRESARAMRTCSRMAERERIIQIPNILLSVKDASIAISVSSKMVRLLINSGRLKAVNLGKRMTRISLQELTDFAQGQGCNVVLPSSSLPFNNKREKKKSITTAKPETGSINKTAKCRVTPTRSPYICPILTTSSDVQELNAATFSLIMIWFLSVPNAATTTLIAKIEFIF